MPERGITAQNCEACQKLLSQLPGVFAAGIRLEGDAPSEIHILASTSRGAKQIARDVQSAIFAMYGVDVDHRIISVAQLPQNPSIAEDLQVPEPTQGFSGRLLISGIESQRREGMFTARIYLNHGGECFAGEAHCRDSHLRRGRTVAQATLNAVHEYLGRNAFELMDVKQVDFGGEPLMISLIEQPDEEPRILVGAVSQGTDPDESVVRSILDAINRKIGLMVREENESV